MLSFFLDALLVTLLVATIICCLRLSKKLHQLRSDGHTLRETFQDFEKEARQASEHIDILQKEAETTQKTLLEHIREAKALSDELQFISANLDPLTSAFRQSEKRPSQNRSHPDKSLNDETSKQDAPATIRQTLPVKGNDHSEVSVKSRAERELLKSLRSKGK